MAQVDGFKGLIDGFESVTGGWPDLLQGSIGSLLGTLLSLIGAFLLAIWTTRHELERERRLTREAAAVESAGRILLLLHRASTKLAADRSSYHMFVRHPAMGETAWLEWWQLHSELQQQLVVDGPLLPYHIEERIQQVLGKFVDAYSNDDIGDSIDRTILPDTTGKSEQLAALVAATTTDLHGFRRELIDGAKA